MAIKRIQVTNMARFEAVDYELPMVCLIQGGNGAGKTGLLDCVRVLGESGHDPDIIRGNEPWGETVVTLDDETQLRVRVTREDTWRGWKPKDGKRWLKGREEIDRIYKAIAYDPLKFLELSAKKQADLLASLSPAKATVEELEAAVGEAVPEAETANLRDGMTGLETINTLHDAIYKARTPLSVAADTQEKHAAELLRALPPETESGASWDATAAELQAAKDKLEEKQRLEVAEISQQFQDAKDGSAERLRLASAEIDTEIDSKIGVLEQQRLARREEADGRWKGDIEAARNVASQLASTIREGHKPALEKLVADLATAQERSRAQQQAEGTRKAAEVARQEAAAKRNRAKILTGSLERLQVLKLKLASQLPIKGAMVDGDKVVREESGGLVPLKKWNTADQNILCLKIGMMLGGGFVCIDHVESFDRPHREALIAAAQKYAEKDHVQFILAAVDHEAGPLQVAEVGR